MSDWRPIEEHPFDNRECILAVFVYGQLYIADRGGWHQDPPREEWDEVEPGVRVKIWEEEQEGHWWTNHCLDFEPTHWMPLPDPPEQD